jgi:hypothetical protein
MKDNPKKEVRKFVRHDAGMAIDITLGDLVAHKQEYLNNISFGGLSFKSKENVEPGTLISIKIPLLRPMFEAKGKVAWCKKDGDIYNVGVTFVTQADQFKLRMLEQVCLIEAYKKEIMERDGRRVTGEQAAIEWINKYADKFPRDPGK